MCYGVIKWKCNGCSLEALSHCHGDSIFLSFRYTLPHCLNFQRHNVLKLIGTCGFRDSNGSMVDGHVTVQFSAALTCTLHQEILRD